MKKYIFLFFIFVLLVGKKSFSQASVTIQKDAAMSCFIGDWDKYHRLSVTINNLNNSWVRIFAQLYRNDTMILYKIADSARSYQVIGNTKVLYLEDFFLYDDCQFKNSLMGDYDNTGRLIAGNYRFSVQVNDTLQSGSIAIGTSATFPVDPYQSAGLVTPYDAAKIYFGDLGSVNYTCSAVEPSYPGTLYYKIVFKELLSGQTEEEAWDFNSTVLSGTDASNSYSIPSLSLGLFTNGKKYIWRILTTDNSSFISIGNNGGKSEVFMFELTGSSANNDVMARQTQTGWCFINDFELNNVEGFRTYTSHYYGGNGYDTFQSIVPRNTREKVTSGSFDPYVSVLYDIATNGGTHSLKLGNDSVDREADRITYMYPVTTTSSLFNMNYSLVFQDAGHPLYQQPHTLYRLYRGKIFSDWDLIDMFNKVADRFDPFFREIAGSYGIVYTPWNCVKRNLIKRLGQTICVDIITTDCAGLSHFGYSYFDFCTDYTAVPSFNVDSQYCITDSIIINGGASYNEDRYYISIEESDQYSNRNPITEISKWVLGDTVGIVNISRLFGDTLVSNINKLVPKCNKYYRVKLAVMNECSEWNEQVKLVKIICPAYGLAGPDKCCDHPPIYIGDTAKAGYTYLWSPTQYLVSPTASKTLFQPVGIVTYPKTYYLKVTTTQGCVSYDTVKIFCTLPTCILVKDTTGCINKFSFACNDSLYDNTVWDIDDYNPAGSGSWEHLQKIGKHIEFNPQYSFAKIKYTLSNACGFKKDSFTVGQRANPLGLDTMIHGNRVEKGHPLIVYQYGKAVGDSFIFHAATEWKLTVSDRWGANYAVGRGVAGLYTGIKNGDITWDGKINGKMVTEGLYVGKLELRYCSKETWDNITRVYTPEYCTRWRWSWRLFCHCKCKDEGGAVGGYKENGAIMFYVNP